MQDIQVQSLGREDPLEKGIATHSSILAWRILWTEGTVSEIAKSWTRLSSYTTLCLMAQRSAMQELQETRV